MLKLRITILYWVVGTANIGKVGLGTRQRQRWDDTNKAERNSLVHGISGAKKSTVEQQRQCSQILHDKSCGPMNHSNLASSCVRSTTLY